MSCPLRVPLNTCYSEYSCYERHHHLLYSSPATWLPECYAANTCGHKDGGSEVFSTFKSLQATSPLGGQDAGVSWSHHHHGWICAPQLDPVSSAVGEVWVRRAWQEARRCDLSSLLVIGIGSAPLENFMWHQIFDILEIDYCKLLEMVLLNALKTFWQFSQLLDSRKKFLRTFGDALRKRMLFLQDLLQVIDIGSEMKEICSNTSIS